MPGKRPVPDSAADRPAGTRTSDEFGDERFVAGLIVPPPEGFNPNCSAPAPIVTPPVAFSRWVMVAGAPPIVALEPNEGSKGLPGVWTGPVIIEGLRLI